MAPKASDAALSSYVMDCMRSIGASFMRAPVSAIVVSVYVCVLVTGFNWVDMVRAAPSMAAVELHGAAQAFRRWYEKAVLSLVLFLALSLSCSLSKLACTMRKLPHLSHSVAV